MKVVYHPRTTLKALFVQLARYGSGRARLAAKHPRSLTLPAVVPPAWAVWLPAGLALAVFVPAVWPVYLLSLLLYAAVVLGGAAWLGRGKPWAVSGRIPAVLVGIHFGFAWGFLREAGRRVWYGNPHAPH